MHILIIYEEIRAAKFPCVENIKRNVTATLYFYLLQREVLVFSTILLPHRTKHTGKKCIHFTISGHKTCVNYFVVVHVKQHKAKRGAYKTKIENFAIEFTE
jgi:hypothetical protein